MEISFFREACETLARFASVREGAPSPQDRIVLQQIDGTLKFIAGSDTMTVIVAAENLSAKDFRAIVSARMLLSAGKALRGKGTVTAASNGGEGAILRVSTGGEVRLPAVSSRVPTYIRPLLTGTKAFATEGLMASAARRAASVADSAGWLSQVAVGVSPVGVTMRAMDLHMYAEHPAQRTEADMELPVPVAFVEALRGIEGAAKVVLNEKHITVASGPYTAASVSLDSQVVPRWPEGTENSSVLADRKALIQMVKGAAPHDEHNRVVLNASGASIAAAPWGKDDAGISLPAKVDGVGGRIGVTADYLLKLLQAIPSAKVGLAWEAGATGVIRVFGENDPWRQLLAPVAL